MGTYPTNDFMTKAYSSLTLMRLIVQGALYFYEEGTQPLYRIAPDGNMDQEAEAFDLVGVALHTLWEQIRILQEAYRQEV